MTADSDSSATSTTDAEHKDDNSNKHRSSSGGGGPERWLRAAIVRRSEEADFGGHTKTELIACHLFPVFFSLS